MRKKRAAFSSPTVVLEQREDTMAATSTPKSLLIQNTTEEPTDAGKIQNDTSKQPWIPFVLRRWVLITFAIVLLSMIAGLEIVKKICDAKHGFGPIDTKLHYIWTYGPTAGKSCSPHFRVSQLTKGQFSHSLLRSGPRSTIALGCCNPGRNWQEERGQPGRIFFSTTYPAIQSYPSTRR
jgi:hypothetical protein